MHDNNKTQKCCLIISFLSSYKQSNDSSISLNVESIACKLIQIFYTVNCFFKKFPRTNHAYFIAITFTTVWHYPNRFFYWRGNKTLITCDDCEKRALMIFHVFVRKHCIGLMELKLLHVRLSSLVSLWLKMASALLRGIKQMCLEM